MIKILERSRIEQPVNVFHFGEQVVRTKVRLMSAPATDHIDFDVMAFMPGFEEDLVPDVKELVVWGEV